ncbi:MAG: hypothetical protein QMC23_09375 [Rubritalea sp.]
MPDSITKAHFFNRYFELLEEKDIVNVVLHSYKDYPKKIDSDVDHCVSEIDLYKVPQLIHEHCEASGWKLVQILQHEVKAFFCICVSQSDTTEYLELDVCSDYMREGKELLSAERILEGRRRREQKSFYIPAPEKEFCYSLWKSVAKNKSFKSVSEKLNRIYQQSPPECDSQVRLGYSMVILEENTSWATGAEEIYHKLQCYYSRAPKVSALSRARKFALRVMQPSGLLLNIIHPEIVEDQHFSKSMRSCFRSIDTSPTQAHIVQSLLKVLKTKLVMGHAKGMVSRVVFNILKPLNAGYALTSSSTSDAVSEVHTYLARRLNKRWRFKD